MTMVWRKIKRTGHEASKFNFNVSFKELVIDFDGDKRPKEVSVACMHRRRKYECEKRPLEKSFSEQKRSLVVWPEVTTNSIDIETTLFKDPNKEQFDNKEWTIVVEEVTKKGKHRALAALAINLCFFVNDSPDVKTELKLKLRPLQKNVEYCTLSLVLMSTLLRRGKATDEDLQSNASAASASKAPQIAYLHESDATVAREVADITNDFDHWKEEKTAEIVKPAPIPAARNAWGAADEVVQPPPPLPPHRTVSTDSHPTSLPSRSSRDSAPVPIERRRESNNSVIRNLPPPPPTPIKDESLLKWCQRITAGYKHVRINDLSRSWRSGLGFCAILHRYDPGLIGNFDDLDFSDTKNGQKSNCQKAFHAAETIGVQRILDESEVTIYPDEKKITEYLRNVRVALQGPDADEVVDFRKSEYRISTVYGLSETEKNVMRDLERMRMLRGDDEVDRAVGTPSNGVLVSSTPNEENMPVPAMRTRRDSFKELEEHEKRLKEMTDQMKKLANEPFPPYTPPLSPPAPAPVNNVLVINDLDEEEEERKKRRLDEARRLIQEINTPGLTPTYITPTRGGRGKQYNYYSVRSAQASPAVERKTYTHSRHGSDMSSTIVPSTSNSNYFGNPHDAPIGAQPSTFDRVKRYGSMRGVELAETLAQFVGPMREPIRADARAASQEPSYSANATPTRKIVTNFEKNVVQVSNISEELQIITLRLSEIDELNRYIDQKTVEPGTEEEQKIVSEKMKLLMEKDSLVRRQDYLNLAAALSEVEEKLVVMQQQINEVTQNNDEYKSEEEKRRIDSLVNEYKQLIDKKNELAVELIMKESEEEEHDERGRRTLERSQNFLRGTQEPLNTSKRIMNWIKSTTS